MYFPTKKDGVFYPIYWLCIIACLYPILEGNILALIVTIPLAALLLWGWVHMGYEITDDYLIIHSGPVRKKISLNEISKVKPTNHLTITTAMSFDRLEIRISPGYHRTFVSPKEKEKFLIMLQEKNPNIKVEED